MSVDEGDRNILHEMSESCIRGQHTGTDEFPPVLRSLDQPQLPGSGILADEQARDISTPLEQIRSRTDIDDLMDPSEGLSPRTGNIRVMDTNNGDAKCGEAIMELARHITGQSETMQTTEVNLDDNVDEK